MLFLCFIGSGLHKYNAAMQMLGPPGMLASGFVVPSLPANAKRETNRETLERLELDLILIGDQQLSAADSYRLYGHDATDHGFWGCGVEAARLDDSSEILVLICSDEEGTIDARLRWMSLSKLYTRKQALLFYEVTDTEGPTEDAMYEVLELFREVFECAVEKNWTYEKRMHFYHAFPFEELTTKDAVMAFRSVLFGCRAFAGFELKVSECE